MSHDETGSARLLPRLRAVLCLLAAVLTTACATPALAGELTFFSGGATLWFDQNAVSHDGNGAWQSGAISHNQTSWQETTVSGPGAVRFWWKVSSESCCDPMTFLIDGVSQANIRGEIDWKARAYAVPEGSHTLRWTYSTDGSVLSGSNAGWVDQVTFEQGSTIDVTPPVTSASPAGGIYAGPQTVILSANDATAIYYTTDGSEPTASSSLYDSPLTILSSTTLKFFAVDPTGNYELTRTEVYTFDTDPPYTYANLYSGTYSGTRDVYLYCNDFGIGCAATYYCLGSDCTPTTLYSSAIAVTTSTVLRYYSVDTGGNNEAVKTLAVTIIPDVTAPSTIPMYAGGTYNYPFSIYLSCYDGDGSGCVATYYCLGVGCTPTTLLSGFIDIVASTDLRYFSVDRSGNSAAVSTASYVIDRTPPTTTSSTGGGIYTTTQSVELLCNDGTGSGCSTTYYCMGKECSPVNQYTGPIEVTFSTHLRFYSLDAVSNQEITKTERYTILTAPPATINVPADKATIQAAIDAANDGDTVVVAPGTYVENINFSGKAITVASSNGADITIIDGNHAGTVVTFNSGEDRTSILDGFTLRNGKGSSDLFYGNGGAIKLYNSSPAILNNRITANTAYAGAGIYIDSGSPLVRNNIITLNQSSGYGGGIYTNGATSAQIVNNTITGNSSTIAGGGIWIAGGTPLRIVQNLIADNMASTGSAIYGDYSSNFFLANNTIVDSSSGHGAVVYVYGYNTNETLINNIVTVTGAWTAIYCGNTNNSNSIQFNRNVVHSASGSAYGGFCTDRNGINGNITADPLLSGATSGYYGLQPGSPAIDAGDNTVPELPVIDLNGGPRIVDGSGQGRAWIDMGTYEYDPIEPRAVLSGPPTGATRESSASFTVGGPGIVSYRYALDSGQFSTTDTPVADPIILSDLTSGSHTVAVIGKSSSREQLVSSATLAEWTIDTLPPVTTASLAGGLYTEPQSVTLTCSDGSGSGCAGTFYCLAGGCTPTTPYSGPISISAPTGLRYFSRDAFGYQEAIKTASFNFVGTISGRAIDSLSGYGMPNLNVTAYNAATGTVSGYGHTGNSLGTYQISGLVSGTYKLRFSSDGYVEQWYSGKADRISADTVVVSAPGETSGIDVIMVKGGSITGRVTDKENGIGIQSISLEVFNAATGTSAGYGYTDSSGAFTVSGLSAGDYKLRFVSYYNSGYLDQWYGNKADIASATLITVLNASTTSGINFELIRGGSITGTVTDSVSGVPIPGVSVTAIDTVTGSAIKSGSTDSSGVYSIIGLSGSYKLSFSGYGYLAQWYRNEPSQARAIAVTVIAPGSITGINIEMVKNGAIAGSITDKENGNPISGIDITVYDSVTGLQVGHGYTYSSGLYNIFGLATGSYKLRFAGSGYVEQWFGGASDLASAATVAVTAPNTTPAIDMELVKGAVITGTVSDKDTGAGIEGVIAIAIDAVSGSWGGSGYTDSLGAYSISGLAGGGYKLQFVSIYTSGYIGQWYSNQEQQRTATVVDVLAPGTVSGIDVALEKGGSISGTVVDSDTGIAIQDSYVRAYSASTGQLAGSGYTDNSGNYSVAGLASGAYKLDFSKTGYVHQWYNGKAGRDSATSVSVTVPDTTAGIIMILVKGGSISGTISDRITGVGIAGANLHVMDRSSGEETFGVQTDSNGSYTISGLASGSYRLRIDAPYGSGYVGKWYGGQFGYLCADSISVTAPQSTSGVDVLLDQGVSIIGRVTDASSAVGIPGVSIIATNVATRTVAYSSSITADPSGAYVIGGLASGEYELIFSAAGYVSPASPTLVSVSATTGAFGVDVALVRGGGISGRVLDSSTGVGISNVRVDAVDTLTRSLTTSVVSDSNGNYTIGGLPDGSYALSYDSVDYGSGWKTLSSASVVTAAKSVASSLTITSRQPDVTIEPISSIVLIAPNILITPIQPLQPLQPIITVNPIPSLLLSRLFPVEIPASAQSFPVVAPVMTSAVDIGIDRRGATSGRVTDASTDEPLSWVSVSAFDSNSGARVGSSSSSLDGTYTINGLPSGSYRIQYTTSGTGALDGGYLSTWYGSRSDSTVTVEVAVQAPETTSGIDASLARGGGISGSISVSSCPGPRQVFIRAYDASNGKLAGQTGINTNNTDRFTIGALPPGDYKLAIDPGDSGFIRQWYPYSQDMASAGPVSVSAGVLTTLGDVQVAAGGGSISGTVSGNSGCTLQRVPITLYDWYSNGLVVEGRSAADGTYRLSGLPDASYKLRFTLDGIEHWYRAVGESSQASPIVVSGGQAVGAIDLVGACSPDGDLDGSGGVPGLLDALTALRIAVGLEAVTPEFMAHGDLAPQVDGVSVPDGRIDIADALLILQKVVNSTTLTGVR